MPQFQPIVLGDKTYTPDEISSVSASAQDLTSDLGKRDRLILDRNVGEGNGKPYRRVLRIQAHEDVGTPESPRTAMLTGTFTLTFPADVSKDAREALMDQMVAALGNADIRKSFGNPEWFF